ncbi:MAG: hypothetical protein E7551_04175 [Ruminococcaceae bacterium]|nr:hypothetical protein [Oscillospiraceae bacterium]
MFFKVEKTSTYTILLAFAFALAIWLNQYFFLKALKCGTMSFTTFIIGSGLVIPIIFGAIVWKENITLFQQILLIVLIFSISLSLNLSKGKVGLKWLGLAILSMLFLGAIGIIQTIQQESDYSKEFIGFLRYSFIFTVIINFLGWQICRRKQKASFTIKSSAILQAGFSGSFMGAVHIINLYLAGALPKVIFFPVSNGGLIFVTLISDLVFFKERLNLKQWIGIILGTGILCVIGL